jgi:menaquinone-9 beta-reductase
VVTCRRVLHSTVTVAGAGPAGASAAIAALQMGAAVNLIEKSRFPRHKVCGEFLSPEIAPVLQELGVWRGFEAAGPAAIRRLSLYFAKSEKHCVLPEPGFGLSRYRLDQLLFDQALDGGARLTDEASACKPLVIAHGRKSVLPRGRRLFGFKAHFEGPAADAIELFFFSGCYVGINCVERGVTNVCGLGPENFLKEFDFDIDAVVHSFAPLAERLRPLTRTFSWLNAGPLEFRHVLEQEPEPGCYPAGDALSFVDPFTGSGLLSAVSTGVLAGRYATRGLPSSAYLAACRKVIGSPFRVSSVLRAAVRSGWAERLVPFVPGGLLVKLTRPHVPRAGY